MHIVLVLDQYVMKRWCNSIKYGQINDLGKYGLQEPMVCCFIWKMQMMRRINLLIRATQLNQNESANCEKYFTSLRNWLS